MGTRPAGWCTDAERYRAVHAGVRARHPVCGALSGCQATPRRPTPSDGAARSAPVTLAPPCCLQRRAPSDARDRLCAFGTGATEAKPRSEQRLAIPSSERYGILGTRHPVCSAPPGDGSARYLLASRAPSGCRATLRLQTPWNDRVALDTLPACRCSGAERRRAVPSRSRLSPRGSSTGLSDAAPWRSETNAARTVPGLQVRRPGTMDDVQSHARDGRGAIGNRPAGAPLGC